MLLRRLQLEAPARPSRLLSTIARARGPLSVTPLGPLALCTHASFGGENAPPARQDLDLELMYPTLCDRGRLTRVACFSRPGRSGSRETMARAISNAS